MAERFDAWVTERADRFLASCSKACENADSDVAAIFLTDGGPHHSTIETTVYTELKPQQVADIAVEEFKTSRHFGALVRRVRWTPPVAWLVIAVTDTGGPAHMMVKRDKFDPWWRKVEVADAPLSALTTAGCLREALDGKRMVFQDVDAKGLV